jgi:hypothetical protein
MKKPNYRLFHEQILLGLALSLLVALLLRGFTCPAHPAGVFALSTPINRNSRLYVDRENNEKSQFTNEAVTR